MIDWLKHADGVGQAVLALPCGGTGSMGSARGRTVALARALFAHRRARARLQLFQVCLDGHTQSLHHNTAN